MADWYYIGHYGQLGPLTLDQVEDLVSGGVIDRDTFVWNPTLSNWTQAANVAELRQSLVGSAQTSPPPPPPPPTIHSPAPPPAGQAQTSFQPYGSSSMPPVNYPSGYSLTPNSNYNLAQQGHYAKSDRSRIAAGVLNIVLPGVGRMYLGYAAYGVLQLFVTILSCGLAVIWPIIDGILILTGSVRLDGYGRALDP